MSAKCANCKAPIGEPDCYIGGRAVCDQKCGEELLARLPRPEPRVINYQGPPVQLLMSLTFKHGIEKEKK